jgi:hypothetical protein
MRFFAIDNRNITDPMNVMGIHGILSKLSEVAKLSITYKIALKGLSAPRATNALSLKRSPFIAKSSKSNEPFVSTVFDRISGE